MQLVIRATNLPVTDPIREHVSKRVLGAVKRFASRLSTVTVVLEDENGPRGGIDKACRIEAGLATTGEPVVVVDRSDDLYGAVDRATGRFKRALARRTERRNARQRRPRRAVA
ncbi:MAG: ribosome-associated translation inhibitor RaiA [Phycisphaeraceae bacterium]|nr:ribosome-associated translation inhibitor RaiA [Phycisphaeraceae bacterium]MCW5769397.1 ribosome-associated translation inhibitor RaiA [Phycisphaeraceae bacterium]